jgi:hypothetical protein
VSDKNAGFPAEITNLSKMQDAQKSFQEKFYRPLNAYSRCLKNFRIEFIAGPSHHRCSTFFEKAAC